MSDVKVKLAAAGVMLKVPRFVSRFGRPIALISLFLLAIATRTYGLEKMPYFPEPFPRVGDQSIERIYFLKIPTVGAALAVASWLLIRGNKARETERILFNGTVMGLFLTLLLIGSYLAPVFYPHYFNVRG